MGVSLEIGKMFSYIMIPISFFYYFSHQDPEYFRKLREERSLSVFGNSALKTEAYIKQRIANEPNSKDFNPKDAFWNYGPGLEYMQQKAASSRQ